MPLTLVLGPANSAKAGEVLGAYGAAARRGALLVVPTALDAEHYSRELAGRARSSGRCSRSPAWPARSPAARGYPAARALDAAARAGAAARARRLRAAGARPVRRGRRASPRRRGADRRAPALAGHARSGSRRRCGPGRRRTSRRDAYAARASPRIYLDYARELERLGRVDSELFAWRALDALRARAGALGPRRRCSSTASTI